MKKIFYLLICCSLVGGTVFCMDEKKTDEKKQELPKPVSDEAAVAESVISGALLGGLLYFVGHKLKWNGFAKGGAAAGGLIGGYVLDSKFGLFPQKTRAAFFKLGLDVLQGKVSDPDLLKKIGELTQECAITFIKELMKQYGADGAQQALMKLKTEVRKGHGYLQAAEGKTLKKRGRLLSVKVDLDEYEKNKQQMADVLQKVEQTEQMVQFKRKFIQARKMSIRHTRNRVSGALRPGRSDAKNLQDLCVQLKEEQKRLPFQCVDQQELEALFETSKKVFKVFE